jgi:Flp pilus assembly protein TadD
MGQIKNALKHISKAHELVQDDATIKKHLAIVYKDMKRYDEAKKHFSEALKICQDQDEKQEILDSLSIMENSVRLPASEAP